MIRHHPAPELLLDFATGAQPQALALAVAGHLSFCSHCRATVAACEALAWELIKDLEPVHSDEEAMTTCLARLEEPAPNGDAERAEAITSGGVPAVLRPHVGEGLAQLPWQSVGGFFDEVKLPELTPGYLAAMLRVAPGKHVPEHGHEGNEYMLVLSGGFKSGGHQYQVGDFSACAGSEEHTPIADDGDDCICLLVLDAPLIFRDRIGLRIGPAPRL
jgi:putative transcriptional regulator